MVYLYSDVTGIILVIRYCFSSGIPVLVQYSTNTGNQCRFNRGIPVLGQYWFYSFCIVQVKYRHTFTVLIQALYHLPHCRYYRYMPVLKQYCNSTGMFTGLQTALSFISAPSSVVQAAPVSDFRVAMCGDPGSGSVEYNIGSALCHWSTSLAESVRTFAHRPRDVVRACSNPEPGSLHWCQI